ncbi:hypothetical protein [Amycolatopsis rifamycinica]|uniref:Uncharacterized protein n=1 Tax=Amycolatopsis rifamycinica TaxID=287986 RepID=A0A066UBI7_9PSEU|nr:hypothetical protein [Amycolatopsis rifamycinica]KDN23202.1 hypothetical protein DV20_05655 [Amycolatopsis rifamycinica]
MTTTHPIVSPHTVAVLVKIAAERVRQDALWGEQNHPDGTGPDVEVAGLSRRAADAAHTARFTTEMARAEGRLTWLHILREEVYEGFAEADPAALAEELIQVAATAACWAEAIERRTGRAAA